MADFKYIEQSIAARRVNLAEWRASRRHELDLPSGLHVVVRDVDMTDILMTGKLPPSVLEMSQEAAQSGEADLEKFGLKLMEENSGDFMTFLNAITRAALVEPAIGEQADDEHITLDELPATDKTAIMEFINRGAEQIRPFRDGEDQPVEAA